MLKVAIIGCGKQADAHAAPIRELPGCELVGACDNEELMAKQLAERFGVRHYFSDVGRLLETTRPDVVHITTPPHSHLQLAKLCLDAGCHLFVEKPFTLNADQAKELLDFSTARRLKITVGHNNQFNHVSRRMRQLIQDGFLGGPPVHMESIWCYDLGDTIFAKALLSDKEHWVRRLPGGLLHNIISHGIGRIVEFLRSDTARVIAHGFASPIVKSINETSIVDELRVIIADTQDTTAYFTFSTQVSPRLQQFRLYGSRNSLVLNDSNQTLIRVKNRSYKYYLNHFVPPVLDAGEYLGNAWHNVGKFMRNDFHFESGRQFLIEAFYRSIVEDAPLPIPYRDILLTATIMDSIFCQIQPGEGSKPAEQAVHA